MALRTLQVMQDVRQSNAFIRAGLAARCGLKNGLGVPIYRDRHVVQVLTLLGAEQFSFVRAVEIYCPERGELEQPLWSIGAARQRAR